MWLIKRKRLGPRLVATAVFIAGVWSDLTLKVEVSLNADLEIGRMAS